MLIGTLQKFMLCLPKLALDGGSQKMAWPLTKPWKGHHNKDHKTAIASEWSSSISIAQLKLVQYLATSGSLKDICYILDFIFPQKIHIIIGEILWPNYLLQYISKHSLSTQLARLSICCTMGIFAAEKRINKEGWNLKNQRKTDKYGSIFEEEITKQLKKWWIRHWKINIWIFKNWKNFMHFHVKSSRFWLFKNWNCYNF